MSKFKIISVDNLDREGPIGDEEVIAENIEHEEHAKCMCVALIDKFCKHDDDRFYKVVPQDRALRKFEP